MECLKKDKLLQHRPDTLEIVRKEVNLGKVERINEAIDLLENWVQKQPHFVKKDFPREYLERTLVTAKGLVERAKERIDRLCTFRTLMPEFFAVADVKKHFERLQEIVICGHLPQLTPKQHRVFMIKVVNDSLDPSLLFNFYKYLIMLSEYVKQNDYCTGFQIVLDYTSINIMNLITQFNPMELNQIITVMTEGYGLRIKGVHVISSSKMVDALLVVLKQVFSSKVSERMHLHKSYDTLLEHLPKDSLPADYGGKEKSLLDLNKEWLEVICSKDFINYMEEMNKAHTNESCRQQDKFNKNYIGMPGSFRTLSVD